MIGLDLSEKNMKKILIMLMLFFVATALPQKKIPLSMYRGDTDTLNVGFEVNGNITTRKIAFVVKNSLAIDSPRVVEKMNAIAGGSDTALKAVYTGGKTYLSVYLYPEDTQDLSNIKRYYDITSTSATNSRDIVTIFSGTFTLTPDVQTPFDGSDLPANATRILTTYPDDFAVGDFLKVDTTNGIKIFVAGDPALTDSARIAGSAITADSSGKTDNSVYARKGVDNEFTTDQTVKGNLMIGGVGAEYKSLKIWNPDKSDYDSLYIDDAAYYLNYQGNFNIYGNFYTSNFIEADGGFYGNGQFLTGIVTDSTRQRLYTIGNNDFNDAYTFTNDPAYANTTPHALFNIHRGSLDTYGANDDLFGLIAYHRPTNEDSTKATIGGAWIGTSDSINNYSSKSWQPLRVQHDHYSSRVNMPTNVITSKFSFYNGAGKARNLKLFTAEIENQKSADAEADTAIAYHVNKNFGDTLSSAYKFAFQNESNAPMVTAGSFTATGGFVGGLTGTASGNLIPSDSTTLKNSVLSQVLKNADSTTLKNSVLSQVLKNADSTTLKNSVLSQVLKNADSTTQRNYSNTLYGGLGSSNTWSGANNTFSGTATVDTVYGGTASAGDINIFSTSHATKGGVFFNGIFGSQITSAGYGRFPIIGLNAVPAGSIGSLISSSANENYQTFSFTNYSNTSWHRPLFQFYRSRGTSSSALKLVSGDNVGSFDFYGHDGAGFEKMASIDVRADGVVGSDSVPSRIVFNVVPAASKTLTEAMRITSAGSLGIGTSTPFSTVTSYVPFTTLSGLNLTYAPTNTAVSSLAQSIDTSSFNIAFTGTGKPVVTLTGATANSIMKIDSAGNIGINVLAPTEKLDVSGNIKADTIKAKISVSNIVGDIATAIWDIRTYSDTLQAGDSLVVTLPSVSGYTFHHASFDSWVADSAGFGPIAIRKGASTNTFISYHTGDVGKRFYYSLYYKPD